jgi:hypothetical protein
MILFGKKAAMTEWSEPMTYSATLAAVDSFIPGKGRYRDADGAWGRWFGPARLHDRLDSKFRQMPIGRLVEVQRQTDKAWLDVEKVAN